MLRQSPLIVIQGAFHSTKISGNSGSNRMEQKFSENSFRKFRFTSRGCPIFWKFGISGNFLFHLAFLPGLNRPQFLQSWKATRWRRFFRFDTTLDAKWSAIVRACSWSKTKSLRSEFQENVSTGRSEFLVVSSPGLHTLPREKFVRFSHKYQLMSRKSWIMNAC